MTPLLLRRFSAIAYEQAGIRLHDGKEALITARIAKRMRALGIGSESEYLARLEADPSGDELVGFLDAISTNFTSFFRESDHFVELSQFLSGWLTRGKTRLRIWSAASSSGQEPYSIAITVAEVLGSRQIDWRILATDISTRVLEQAKAGAYDEIGLRGVQHAHRAKYFEMIEPDRQGRRRWQVSPELQAHVLFKRLNLAVPPYPMKGPFDVVFCRNVMIYFDQAVRQVLVDQIERLLAPDGLLCIGHSETLTGVKTGLRMLKPSIYSRRLSAVPARVGAATPPRR